MKNFSLTVGISAFNEESNIGELIREIRFQKISGAKLVKIIIISDGSRDKTVTIAKKFKDAKIKVIDDGRRLGKAQRQNEIITQTSSDILVLLDADIIIKSERFLERLVKPILEKKADLAASLIRPLTPKTFIEGIFFASTKLKEGIFSDLRGGNNLYSCYGPARAFSRNFYKNLHIPKTDGDDMYSYLSCIKLGFKFTKAPKTVTYYRLPSNLKDHFKQSLRYRGSTKNMNQYFDKEFLDSQLKIPFKIYLKFFWKSRTAILRNYIPIILYILIVLYLKALSSFMNLKHGDWDVRSTKILRSYE